MKRPVWPPRDWRMFVALFASIGGAAVLTGLLWWTIRILERGAQLSSIANIAYGLLFIIGIVLLSFGMAITPRSIKAQGAGMSVDMSGGDDGPAAQVTTTTATIVKGSTDA